VADWLCPHVHGGEVCATSVFGLMAPQSPDDYRWETWWYYSQGGPGVFKGDLYFYSVDHDFRGKCEAIKGKIPTYFITGEYDFACTPEMTRDTAAKVKNSEVIMRATGTSRCRRIQRTKRYLTPVLEKDLAHTPGRFGQGRPCRTRSPRRASPSRGRKGHRSAQGEAGKIGVPMCIAVVDESGTLKALRAWTARLC
jgi:hypothetical protein